VTYPTPPSAQVADDEVLICCARPAQQEDEVQAIQLAL
jgi:hypothetical protein